MSTSVLRVRFRGLETEEELREIGESRSSASPVRLVEHDNLAPAGFLADHPLRDEWLEAMGFE